MGPEQVQVVRWPVDAARRAELHASSTPCLLLLRADAEVPSLHPTEDWIRVPAEEEELVERIRRLALRAAWVAHPPELADGVLRHGDDATTLSESDAALVAMLLEHPGGVVARSRIEARLWPGGVPGTRTLDARVARLRRRIAVLGLALLTVRGEGIVLEVTTALGDGPLG